MRKRILEIAALILNNPTAPFREGLIREAIVDFCSGLGIETRIDKLGNVIAKFQRGGNKPAIALSAHMDHPGFIIEKSTPKRLSALFYGGVEKKYFPGSKVTVYTEDGPCKTRVLSVTKAKKERALRARLSPVQCRRGDIACWDLPSMKIKGDLLYSRACDDLVGCVSILALFEKLVRRKIRANVIGLFTVAEESGLNGAKYICTQKQLGAKTPIISIETSARRPDAKIASGVVIRVGDKQSIFSPHITTCLLETAQKLAKQNRRFKFQRKLMDGGTCEGTVYHSAGQTTGAVCICLGNYHNRNDKRTTISPEFVSINDLESMVELLIEIARTGFAPLPYRKAVFRIEKGTLGQVHLLSK